MNIAQIVVIDSRVSQATELLSALPENATVHWLSPEQDGLEQLLQALAAAPGVWQAIHILSHGAPGELVVGASRIDLAHLTQRASEWATLMWKTHPCRRTNA